MTDTLIDRRDLAFQLYEVLDTESLSERERFSEHSRDTFDAVIETADKIARDKFATHNSAADKDEPKFVDGQVEMLPRSKKPLTPTPMPASLPGATTTNWVACSSPNPSWQRVTASLPPLTRALRVTRSSPPLPPT